MNKRKNAKYKPALDKERDLPELSHCYFLSCIEVAVSGAQEVLRLILAITLVVVREQRSIYTAQRPLLTQCKEAMRSKKICEGSSQIFKIQPGDIYVTLFGAGIENKHILIYHHQII